MYSLCHIFLLLLLQPFRNVKTIFSLEAQEHESHIWSTGCSFLTPDIVDYNLFFFFSLNKCLLSTCIDPNILKAL